MEAASASENSQHSTLTTGNVDPPIVDVAHDGTVGLQNHERTEPTLNITFDEGISILEVIAATGKFWHDWDMLKSLLSSRLKQVLSEYPEAKGSCTDGPQPSTLPGETYTELVQRLNEALLSFIEGPPFTLQRLCEILLAPKSIYRTLSKLALALEKNLLVTSTLTICTDPYSKLASSIITTTTTTSAEVTNQSESNCASVTNGLQTTTPEINDEEMVEAEADDCGSDVSNRSTSDDQTASDVTLNKEAAQNISAEVNDNAQVDSNEAQAAQNVDVEMQEGDVADDEPNSKLDAKAEQTETEIAAEVNHSITQQ